MRPFCLFALGVSLAAVCAGGKLADDLYQQGRQAERTGDTLHAYLLFARALALEPTNAAYAAAKSALAASGPLLGQQIAGVDPADESLAATLVEEGLTSADILDLRQTVAPPKLAGTPGKKSFDLKGDARTIFEKVAEAYGLAVIFDSDYQTPPPFTFRMEDVNYQEALHALEQVSDSFIVAVNDRLALVARDTVQKRTEIGPVMSLVVPIPERMTPQDTQELVATIQQIVEIRRITVDPARRVIYMRDSAAKVNTARLLLATLSRLRTQVEVEVEFLSAEKNSALSYGLNLPSSFPIVNFGTVLHNMPSIPSGITSFLTFGGGATFLGMGIADAAALATVTRSSTDVLLHSQVVTLDGQLGTLHIGNHYPVITTGYYGTTTGTGQVYTPPPTINYEDLGLVLKVTPAVHSLDEVTLDVDAEFKVLGTSSSNGIPVIASRTYQGKVRLQNGEWAVIAGLVTVNDTRSQTGVAGLASIPWIGNLFGQKYHQTDSTQVLVVLKPHIVTLPPSEYVGNAIWMGTEGKPLSQF